MGIKDYKRSEYHVKLQSGRVSKVRSGGAPAAWQGGGKSFYTLLLCFTWLGPSSSSLLPSSSIFFHPDHFYFALHGCKEGCRQKLEHPGRLGAAGGGREEAKNNPSGQDLPPILPNLHLVYHQHCIAWPCQVGVLWYRERKKLWQVKFRARAVSVTMCLCRSAGSRAQLAVHRPARNHTLNLSLSVSFCLCVFVSSSLYLLLVASVQFQSPAVCACDLFVQRPAWTDNTKYFAGIVLEIEPSYWLPRGPDWQSDSWLVETSVTWPCLATLNAKNDVRWSLLQSGRVYIGSTSAPALPGFWNVGAGARFQKCKQNDLSWERFLGGNVNSGCLGDNNMRRKNQFLGVIVTEGDFELQHRRHCAQCG